MTMALDTNIIFKSLIIGAIPACYYGFTKSKLFNPMMFELYIALIFLSYFFTDYVIKVVKDMLLKASVYGMDINKRGTKEGEVKIPESGGVAPAAVYMIFITCYVPYFYSIDDSRMQVLLTSSTLAVSFCTFLGFVDDILDLKWRYKVAFPVIAVLPVIVHYPGTTIIAIPKLFHPYFGTFINIGLIYYVYIIFLSIFCMNSINIYAGINGLEVGQSLVIGFGIVALNVIEISTGSFMRVRDAQTSLFLIVPFIAVSLALLKWNKYPSKVFVGDIYCYFAGIVFAVCGILGHFSKGLLLLFIPQILNFVFSIPQLFGIKHCPRHRLAKYDIETGLLNTTWPENNNMLNFALWVLGPTSEKKLNDKLIAFQVLCCGIGILINYTTYHLIF